MKKFHRSINHIVILSGKGGTGKTTITSSLVKLMSNCIAIDCDVEAANLHLSFSANYTDKFQFYGGKKAFICEDKCIKCGKCETVCNFDAINDNVINLLECEGCGFCYNICPNQAILFEQQKTGCIYKCELENGSDFFYARLLPGEGNSGRLVTELKVKAMERIKTDVEWIIVDGPPGIGCPVNASLAYSDYVIIVTEPTKSAVHDLNRLLELLKILKLPSGIFINKYDLNKDVCTEIENIAIMNNLTILGKLPFDERVFKVIREGKTILDLDKNNSLLNDVIKLIKNELYRINNKLVEI
jgi:MinD superfamily P-loop ATPase